MIYINTPANRQGTPIEHLLQIYLEENFRIDKHVAADTKEEIRKELYRRVDTALRIIDKMGDLGDEENDARISRFYRRQFLTGNL